MYDHVTRLIKFDKIPAMKYRHATRFIDDQCHINDSGEFGKSFLSIYPPDLDLKCEHNGNHATFLDLDISIADGLFIYKLFDKRDNFPFHIIRMPDRSSNIPSYVFYGRIMSEFIRISRTTLLFTDFLPKAKKLTQRMVTQGGNETKV